MQLHGEMLQLKLSVWRAYGISFCGLFLFSRDSARSLALLSALDINAKTSAFSQAGEDFKSPAQTKKSDDA